MPTWVTDGGGGGTTPPPDGSTPPPTPPPDGSQNGGDGGGGDGAGPAPPRRHHTQPKKALRQNIAAWKPEDRPGAFRAAVQAHPTRELAKLAAQHGGVVAESQRASTRSRPSAAGVRKRTTKEARRAGVYDTASLTRGAGQGGDDRTGRVLASAMPGAGYPGGLPLPKPKKLGKVELSSGVSNKVPIRLSTSQFEISGHLQATAELKWRGGRGKTAVSIDPASHSISIDHGPLSFSDSGRLSDRLVQALRRHPADAASGHRRASPFGVDLALGEVDLGGKTGPVKITAHVATEGFKQVVSIDASTEVVTRKALGYGQITLKYSLVADVTVDRREKQKQRSKSPYQDVPVELTEAALIALALAVVLRRIRMP